MSIPFVGLCQRGFNQNTGNAHYILRNFTETSSRFDTYFAVTLISSTPQLLGAFKHGGAFDVPAGELLAVSVVESDPSGIPLSSETLHLTLQPYKVVCPGYKIFHFFHEPNSGIVWAIGDSPNQKVQVLKSKNNFNTFEIVYSWPATQFGSLYRAMYIDKFGNIIVGSRPSPLISRNKGQSWRQRLRA